MDASWLAGGLSDFSNSQMPAAAPELGGELGLMGLMGTMALS